MVFCSVYVYFCCFGGFAPADTHAQIEESKQNTIATNQAVIDNHKNEIKLTKLITLRKGSRLIIDAISIASKISEFVDDASKAMPNWGNDESIVIDNFTILKTQLTHQQKKIIKIDMDSPPDINIPFAHIRISVENMLINIETAMKKITAENAIPGMNMDSSFQILSVSAHLGIGRVIDQLNKIKSTKDTEIRKLENSE